MFRITIDPRFGVPLGLLIALQVVDVVVHIATDQIEPIRIASNLVLAGGALVGVARVRAVSRTFIASAAAIYLGLNLIFLAQHGLINPTTGGVRAALFVFVLGSLVITYWLTRRAR